MSANAEDFAKTVLAAFTQARLFTLEQIEEAGGPSSTTVSKLRKAAEGSSMARPRTDTMRKIETAAKWPDRSASVLWEEGSLPDQDTSRAIGSGGVPAPETFIESWEARVEDGDERCFRVSTTGVDRLGNESVLEIRYWPAKGQEVKVMDLGPVASQAHHEAVKVTYLEGTRPSLRPLSVASDTTDDLVAAHEEERPISGEQGESDTP